MPTEDISQPMPGPRKITYEYAGKETLSQSIGAAVPKPLIPTKRMASIFVGVFIIVLIIAVFQLPFSGLMSGDVNIKIKIGYPFTFLELGIQETSELPVKIANLFLDMLIYLIVSYILDVTLSLIITNPLVQSEDEKKKKPVTFKDQKKSLAERAAEKFVKEPEKTNL
jgi:hypothetical protein